MEENVIKIEDNIPMGNRGRRPKYSEYYDILYKLESGQSFLVDDIYVVEAVRYKAWEEKISVSYRTIKEPGLKAKYRIWKL